LAVNDREEGEADMTHDLNGIRVMKLNGKGGPHISSMILRNEILSGYMYPKLHRGLRRIGQLRKRKVQYE
jgi:hypothetical protein